MKTNLLSVKKLTNNLILRALRVWNHHSYMVGHATTKVENLHFWNSSVLKFFSFSNSSTLQSLHYFRRFSSLAIYIYGFMSSTTFTYGYFFKLRFLLSECDHTLSPLCYTQPNLFTNSSCAFYLKLVQNLHCVLVSWRNCERNFKIYLI